MFADTGQEVIECGKDFAEISCCLVQYMKLVAAGNVLQEGMSATQWQKSHI